MLFANPASAGFFFGVSGQVVGVFGKAEEPRPRHYLLINA
jgi:hypothetical protein